ncbi:RNA binding motif protein 12Bb isoform X2 [Pseudochaenichthys georgianus]|uniref:RNA binding motif protein 12Bb isoform X2 n=1 Tax=Pseudochaenichthys georgianus TaxID=52239 RepID=UPI0039C244A5
MRERDKFVHRWKADRQAYYLITSSAQQTCSTSSSGDGASEPGEYSNNNKDPFEDSCLGLAARTSICACTQVKIYRGSRAFTRATTTKDQRTSITTAASISICACHKIKIHLGTKASTTAITINPASKEVSPSTPPSHRHSHQQPMHHHPHQHSSQTHCLGRQTKTLALPPLSLHL